MIIVSDTSSLYYAAKIECDFLIPHLFGDVYIPTAVQNELNNADDAQVVGPLLSRPWLNVQAIKNQQRLQSLLPHIDLGEAEAITLALELSVHDLFIDERKGTAMALKFGLKPIGLLGLLLIGKGQGHIAAVKPFLDNLIANTTFRYTDTLIESVLKKANEL